MQVMARIPCTEEFSALLLDLTAEGAYAYIVSAMRRHSLVLAVQQVLVTNKRPLSSALRALELDVLHQ